MVFGKCYAELNNSKKSIPTKEEKNNEDQKAENSDKDNTKGDKIQIQNDNNESILELAFKNLILDDDNDNSPQKKT